MRVEVYRNLHKTCWSVRDVKTGLVIDHVDSIHIQNATLVVQPAGRKKVLKEQKKNVHAFIRGTISDAPITLAEKITYNPYKRGAFVLADSGEPINHACHVYLDNHGKAYTGTLASPA